MRVGSETQARNAVWDAWDVGWWMITSGLSASMVGDGGRLLSARLPRYSSKCVIDEQTAPSR